MASRFFYSPCMTKVAHEYSGEPPTLPINKQNHICNATATKCVPPSWEVLYSQVIVLSSSFTTGLIFWETTESNVNFKRLCVRFTIQERSTLSGHFTHPIINYSPFGGTATHETSGSPRQGAHRTRFPLDSAKSLWPRPDHWQRRRSRSTNQRTVSLG